MKSSRLRKLAAALVIALVSTLVALLTGQTALLKTMEWKVYDLQLRGAVRAADSSQDIVLVEIDDWSIERMAENNFGRFPWPRDTYAALLRYLERGRPKAVTFDVLFLEEDKGTEGAERDAEFVEATRRLGNVLNAIEVNDTHDYRPDLPSAAPYRLTHEIEEHKSVKTPFRALALASRMLGSTFFILDADGPVRRSVPFVRQGDSYYPSLAVATAMVALGLQPSDVRMDSEALCLGSIRIPLIETEEVYVKKTRTRHLLIRYKGPPFLNDLRKERSYPSFSFWDLALSEGQIEDGVKPKVDPAIFRDKIVFIGTTAAGLHDLFQTPFGEQGKMPGMQIHASVVDSILSRSFLRPAQGIWPLLLLAVSTLLVGLLGVHLGFWWALLAAASVGFMDAGSAALAFRRGVWLPCVPAVIGLITAQFSSVAYKYFVEDKAKRQVKALFSRYVSPEVVRELVDDPSKARLGGHRREMTVLFSDIRGFTTISEAGRPEDVIGQLNEYFSRMVDLLFQHHGTLDKFVGDMIMGLFNAPIQDPDHADHAVQMGLSMLRELKVLNERWTQEGKPAFDIGVGINTGDMIVGNVGSERTLSYTVIGDNVNLGSRLESLNKQFQSHIIISESTRGRLKGNYFIRPLGMVKVKGKLKEVGIFEVCASEEELRSRHSEEANGAVHTQH